jgi:uncharacterized repeat protein (TIGR03803 family)
LLLLALVALNAQLVHAQASAPAFTVLYNFAGPPDGGVPYAAMVFAGGNLYGTTYVGGKGTCTIEFEQVGCGTVFKVAPNNNNKETVLHSFKGQPDGESPIGGLVRDAAGNLYGTTVAGGAFNSGTIFKLSKGKETILYSFKGKPDGDYPAGTLLPDASGNFYGTTSGGGANLGTGGNPVGGGTVFKLDASGNETVLYSFCSQNPSGICLDGANPNSGLIMDAKGNLYGTASNGGNTGVGTVFKLDASRNETVLYSFCPVLGSCTDGADPEGGLVMDAGGNLYGTTTQGQGSAEHGVVFKLDTSSGHETVLHNFCTNPRCPDGGGPRAGLVLDAKGFLYGTSDAAVFKIRTTGSFSVLHTFATGGGDTGPLFPVGGVVLDPAGNIYGTTSQGGTGNCNPLEFFACGVVFKITP